MKNEKERKLYNEELKKLQTQLARRDQQFLQYEKRCSKIQVLSLYSFNIVVYGSFVFV